MAIELEKEIEKEVVKKAPRSDKARLEAMRERDNKMVKGIFHYYEVPNGIMEFRYAFYKEDDYQKIYSMKDGEVYTVPLGVARHLNNDCWYPVHAFTKDEFGNETMKIGKKVKRCGFQSLEFVDEEDIGNFQENKILTAEMV